MIPQMMSKGYPRPFAIALSGSAAVLEALIPSSNEAILFSALADVPVSRAFAAGSISGSVPTIILSCVVTWKCRHLRNRHRSSFGDRLCEFPSA